MDVGPYHAIHDGNRNDEALCKKKDDDIFKDQPNLLRMFPEEIWHMIFDFLMTEPDDLENVSNASLYFRHLLIPKQTLFLFPKIWKIFDINYHQKYLVNKKKVKRENKKDNTNIDAPPKKERYQKCGPCQKLVARWWNVASLNFRLVCHYWKSTVDGFYQATPAPNPARTQNVFSEEQTRGIRVCSSKNTAPYILISTMHPTSTEDFMRHFDPTHCSSNVFKNPFPSRSMRLRLGDHESNINDEDDYDVNQAHPLVVFLKKYGQHLWHLQLCIDDDYWDSYRTRTVLRLLPNLKTIHITSLLPTLDSFQNQNLGENEKSILSTDSLKLLYCKGIPFPLVNAMISHNSKLEFIEVRGQAPGHHQLQTFNLPNLQHIALTLETEADFLSLVSDNVNWPLTNLIIHLKVCTSLEWPTIYQRLEQKWSDTLTALVVHLPDAKNPSDIEEYTKQSSKLRLNFPKLKILHLTLPNFLCTLDCVLPMKGSLECLTITVCYDQPQKKSNKKQARNLENGKVIQMLQYSDDLYKSNVWLLFSKLERLQIIEHYLTNHPECTFTGTRGQWEKYMSSMTNKPHSTTVSFTQTSGCKKIKSS